MFRTLTAVLTVLVASFALHASDATKETRLFELRIYTAAEGKLDALNARFRDHTLKFFEKYGITSIGYWVSAKGDDNKLYYIVAHKDRKSRDEAFKNLLSDADALKMFKESEKDGKLVEKIEEIFLTATDYSPEVKAEKAKEERVFEMRTYTATKGNLEALNARFRDHTVKLFAKYGMSNLYYFTVAKGSKGEDTMLIYFLAHKSEDAAKKSFDEFRKDEEWIKAKDASEKAAGGSLTEKEGGVKSVFLKATDYSMTK